MRLRHCFIASMAILFGLASPLCTLACMWESSSAQTGHELMGDSKAPPCHDSGPPGESDKPSDSCEDGCMRLQLATASEPVWDRASQLVALLPESRLVWRHAPDLERSSRDLAQPEPPQGPSILLLKSTLLI